MLIILKDLLIRAFKGISIYAVQARGLGIVRPAIDKLSPNVVKVLVENFGIAGISNVEDDVKMFIGIALKMNI